MLLLFRIADVIVVAIVVVVVVGLFILFVNYFLFYCTLQNKYVKNATIFMCDIHCMMLICVLFSVPFVVVVVVVIYLNCNILTGTRAFVRGCAAVCLLRRHSIVITIEWWCCAMMCCAVLCECLYLIACMVTFIVAKIANKIIFLIHFQFYSIFTRNYHLISKAFVNYRRALACYDLIMSHQRFT